MDTLLHQTGSPLTWRIVSLTALGLLFLPAFLTADTLNWTGNVNGNWSEANNWNPTQTPDAGDSLIFNNNVQTTQTAFSVALERMTWGASAGAFTISGGFITFNVADGGLFNESGQTQSLSNNFQFFAASQTVDHGNGSFTLGGAGAFIRFRDNATFNGAGSTSLTAGTLEIRNSPTFTVNDGTVTVNSTISDETATANNFFKAGGGTLELLAANTFGGNFFLNEGTLVVGDNGALGGGSFRMGSVATTTFRSQGGLDRNFSNVLTMERTLNVEGGGTLTFSGATGTFGSSPVINIEAGTTLRIEHDMSGTSTVNKNQEGRLVLAGDNSYSGSLFINAGELEIANSSPGAGAGTGTLNIGASALLTGAGFSENATVVINGTLSPGANGGLDEGTLNFDLTNQMTFGSNSTLALQAGDRIEFASAGDWLNVNSGAAIDLSGTAWSVGWNTFGINVDTLPSNLWTLTQDSIDAGFTLDNTEAFRISGNDIQFNLATIPEPRAALLIFFGMGLLMLLRHPPHSRRPA